MGKVQQEPIAIIGMGCRFPGANDPREFWQLLCDGRSAIREVPASRWHIDAMYDADPAKLGKTTSRWGGFIENVDQFDWRTFRILPREAKYIDPQHRLLLEVAWEAFEDAGLPLEEIAGSRTSVSIGITWNDYLRLQLRDWSKIDGYGLVGNPYAFAANRLSYMFDLKGPSVSLDAGCTSSQASLYFACQSLWTGEASLAIAGGVNLMLSPDSMIMVAKAGLLSPEGVCEPLDPHADGFVLGEGAGIVVLKPLSQLRPSDRVYALIRGIEMNHNGHIEWIMGTSAAAQEELLSEAYRKADIQPAEVGYVELHGTGFLRGDQIEAHAVGTVLGRERAREHPCLIGSVKTNLGNLGSAAGIASVMKVALSVYHQQIPPTLNIETLNPEIPLDDLRLAVPQVTTPWPDQAQGPVAGVTTLSFTGINAHTILSAPPTPVACPEGEEQFYLLPLSARSEKALIDLATSFKDFLRLAPRSAWRDICYTASVRRSHHKQRFACAGRSPREAAEALEVWLQERQASASQAGEAVNAQKRGLAALLSQEGSLQQDMLNRLLGKEAPGQTAEESAALLQRLGALYTSGQTINWSDLYAEGSAHCISLPTYPWQRERVWLDWLDVETISTYPERGISRKQDARDIYHTLLERHVEVAYPAGTHVWQIELDKQTSQRLAEESGQHEPGVSPDFLQKLVLTAARMLQIYPCTVDDIAVQQTLPLAQTSSRQLQLMIHAADKETPAFQLFSLPGGDEQGQQRWQLHCSGTITRTPLELSSAPVLPTVSDEPLLSLVEQMAGACPEAWQELIQAYITRQVHELLELDATDELDPHQNLLTTGMDSLLAMRLVNSLQQSLERTLPSTLIFTYPTIALLSEYLKREVAARPESTDDAYPVYAAAGDAAVLSAMRPTHIPLSLAQQRLWFLDQLNPGLAVYNEFGALRLSGPFRRDAFEQSILEIIRRHDILRTTFSKRDGEPAQNIAPTSANDVKHVDLRYIAASLREEQALDLAKEDIRSPISLEQGPLFKISLFQLEEDEHILLILFHHIIGDGWSMGLLYQELAYLYEKYCHNQPVPLSAHSAQYADFVLWQHQYLQGEFLTRQLNYWRDQLSGATSILQLPTDRPRPALPSNQGGHHVFTLEASLTSTLKRTGQREGVTLFTMLLAVLYVLLYRYSQQEDILIGTSVANRDRAEFEKVLGFFINNLVLRAKISGATPFLDFLAYVQNVAVEAYTHKDVPFDMLVKELQPQRAAGIAPFFQVLFVLQDISWIDTQLFGLAVKPLEIDSGLARFDLYLSMVESREGLRGSLEYNTDIFDAWTIEHMVEHLRMLLTAVAHDPSQQIGALPLLTAAEYDRLLVAWNATDASFPLHRSLPALFAEQVARTPQAIALVEGDTALTYQEVHGRSNQLAHLLLSRGVGPGALVGVYMDRSPDMVISMLAIFKAGGAYVPLDPNYPAERLTRILADAAMLVIVTHPHLLADLPPGPASLICLASGDRKLDQYAAESPPCAYHGSQLAYVIYTSGSTGRPKGVMVTHEGMLNHLFAKITDLRINATDRIAQTASHCFDISVWQFFAALLQGGQVHIFSQELATDPIRLISRVEAAQITLLEIVPSLLRALLNTQEMHETSTRQALSLRWLLVTGEAFPVDLSRHWLQEYPQIPLVNAYGPTECSDDVTHAIVTRAPDGAKPTIPIGRALANTRLYLLDRALAPVPVGVPGTLYVGGTGVGRGYLNDPARTALAFLPNPFAYHEGERLYCTGDLARYLPDGNVEFLGRTDQQVKIRGFRIELGEIEATILQHNTVKACVVLAHEFAPDDRRLVAYIVFKSPSNLPEMALRAFLRQQLPVYMVPTILVPLDALPLTANGKIHYQALPQPEMSASAYEYALAPQNAFEEIISGIWKNTLNIGQIGIGDNFFEFGGHSLLATRLIARVNAFFHVQLSLRQFFDAPTIERVAQLVEEALHSDQGQESLPLVPSPRTDQLPTSFTQQRLWFLDQLSPDNAFYNLCGTLHFKGQLDRAAFVRSIQAIVQRHEALRTTFATIDGRPIQVVAATSSLALTHLDISNIPDDDQECFVRQFAGEQASLPFDLATGPLLRMHLLRLCEEQHVFLVVMHHIVSDGWSLGVFTRELHTLYNACVTRQDILLPALPIQYADYALWQRQRLASQALQKQLQYWQQQLAGIPPLLELPTDRPRPSIQTFHGAHSAFTLSAQESGELARFSQREGVTVFMTLLAVLQVLLSRYTGQEDIVVGTAIANRNQAELENLIGFFVNTLAIRSDLSGDPGFRAFLQQVCKTCLDAYTHQDLPFEQVVDVIQPERSLSISPLFQVMFVLQNGFDLNMEFVGLDWHFEAVHNDTAKFDLTLVMTESAQGLAGTLEYNTALFDAASIEHFLAHFQALLQAIIREPDRSLSQLPIFSPEQHRQFFTWEANAQTCLDDVCIQQLFEKQVQQTPDALAIVGRDASITYAQLNRRANRLAHYLLTCDIQPETIVGLCLPRSVDFIIGMLGILKAGGAYLPLDPDYPSERLAFLLRDVRAPLLLTQQHLMERLPQQIARIVCLDTDWPLMAGYAEENPPVVTQAGNLAYVIYTSGSTGKPKGVQVVHHNLRNLLSWHIQSYTLQPTDRATQIASVAFDACVWEIWPYLVSGASLHLPTEETRLSPTLLRDWLIEQGITVSFLPTPLAESVMAVDWPSEGALRALLTGGDKLQHYPVGLPFRLVNHYGPTEFTVVASAGAVQAFSHAQEAEQVEHAPALGRPIAGTQVYLLDRHMAPVPCGALGELYLGGASLARGYLHRPEWTAERFVPNPFGTEKGTRLYRTGDLVRYLPDGSLEFMGRIDDQVKVRGYRIELGEIEIALNQHPDIQDALVLAREDMPGARRLVAYVVPRAGALLQTAVCQDYLKAQLPDYMVPAIYVQLEALPLTTHGKVDRKALPLPDYSQHEEQASLTAPQNQIEQVLAEIWEQVLGIDQVGIHDNFFTLGGDSILSIQIVSRAAQAGIRVSPQQFFQYQSIAELAAHVTMDDGEGPSAAAGEDEVSGTIPLTPIQRWFFALEQAEPHYWNQALLLSMHRRVEMTLLEKALEQILLHHDTLRLRFLQEDGQWLQRHGAGEGAGTVPCLVVDLAPLDPSERLQSERVLIQEVQAGLNLEAGPLFRAAYFKLGADQPDQLLLVIHHLLIDGVSWRILLEDIETAYTQLLEQRHAEQTPRLPAKTGSFQRWSQQLVAFAQSEALLQDLPYWLAQCQGEVLSLPRDHARGENTVASARSIRVALSKEETSALLYEVPAAYHTQINDVLVTALVQVLTAWLGAGHILLDLEGHGREDLIPELDISRTVGWFTALYPLRVDLGATGTPIATLKRIKEQLRGLPRKGVGYGLLYYLCEQSQVAAELEQLRTQTGAEIMFNYRGQFDQFFSNSTLFNSAVEPDVPAASPAGRRHHLLETIVSITEGQLAVEWIYSQSVHHASTIAKLADAYKQALSGLIAHCQLPTVGGYTPTDFPLATLDQRLLDALFENNRQVEALFPLSPLQQGLLFHSLYAPGGGDYIIQVGFTLQGFDIPAFIQAWEHLVERHTPLRTAFLWEGLTEPHQVVYRQMHLPVAEQDWRSCSAQEQEDLLIAYYQADRERGFTLTSSPLMRLVFLRVTDDTYKVVWSHHHLLLDGWSVPIVLKELFTAYEALRQGRVPVQEKVRPYQDYLAWLRQQEGQRAEAFWRATLQDFSSPTPLAITGEKEYGQHAGYGEQILCLEKDLSQALQNLARRQQMTLNTLVQGTWSLLLSHYSGENDVLFGSVVAGRPSDMAGVETMVGLFINTLPVRVKLAPDLPLRSWLQELQARQTELRSYEYSSLAQIQGWSRVPKGTPLFESLVIFENYPLNEQVANRHVAGDVIAHALRTVQIQEQTHYPLNLVVTPGAQLQLRVLYDRGRFSAQAIARLLTHLQQLFRGLPDQLDRPLAALSLLPQEEYHRLAVEYAHREDFRSSLCLHERFEEQVGRSPEAIAVVYEDSNVTYQEMNLRANQLAFVLREQGVGPECFVGLCVERSIDLITGILGILKAGGTYVPLDPSYPAERLAFIIDDARVPVLLTQHHLAASLADYQATVICIDTLTDTQKLDSATNPRSGCVTTNAAYTIYTSGSTGSPKGVVISHENVTRLFDATHSWFHFTEKDTWTLFHSYAFDFSVWEIWGPLLHGGRLVVVPYWVSRSTEMFYALLHTQMVTILSQTPSAFLPLIQVDEAEHQSKPLALRKVIFGGEALELQSLQPWFARHGDQKPELINMYGITETTVHVTCRPLSMEDLAHARGSVIGLPMPDLQVYILDQYKHLAPLEVPGEIYVGGAGLARVYLNRPDLTGERFIPHPFSTHPGERLYKTGDLARRLPNGDIEYLGRIDHQVKIRGFRIELGEIEAAITAHSAVHMCVVTLDEHGTANKRLVAYVMTHQGTELGGNALRQWLQQRLPDYMVPSALIFLDTFPLTPNGKVDYHALPAPNRESQDLAKDFAAPRTSIEQVLADIWAQVLRIEQVGIHDNFFELGGDSILSIQIVGRASQAGLRLTPRQLFEHQTIAELGMVVDSRPAIMAEQGLVLGSAPLSPIQCWFFEQEIPELHHWNQSVLFSVAEHLDALHMEAALRALLLHHDALRTRFVQLDGGWQQTYVEQEEHTLFFIIDLAYLPPAEQARVQQQVESVLQRSMNLFYGPLLRTVYFKLGQRPRQDDLFLMVIHHLVVDGVSWRILLEDLQTAYNQSRRREALRLPPKTTSFKAWSQQLVDYAGSSALQQEADYWLSAARADVLPLPTDFAAHRQLNTIASAETVTTTLSGDETRVLLEQLPSAYHTQINDVLLTALYQTFAQWTGASSLLVDLEGHGREEILNGVDLSRTVGWFTSIFPVLLEGEPGAESLIHQLKTMKEQLRNIPNKGVNYGILRYLSKQALLLEQLEALPQAQVAFNYLGTLDLMVTGSRLFATLRPSDGPTQCIQAQRKHLLEVNSWVNNNQFTMSWEYSQHFYHRSTIEQLAHSFMAVLRSLLAQAQAPEINGYTPSDFPDVDVDQETLEQIIAAIDLD